ncbi:MAG: rod shape-determining protein MreC [Alphaproteobacteria bacterium]|nr:rod shape-determining protein MreC [Alphaproteobacteria bacterium]
MRTNERKHRVYRLRTTFDAWWHRGAIVILLIVSGGLLLSNRADTSWIERVRMEIADASIPIYELASAPADWFTARLRDGEMMLNVYAENRRLREENERLRQWQHTALSLEQRVSRYEALLNVKTAPAVSYVAAQVVAETGGPFVHAVLLNAGDDDGVRPGQAVVNDSGLVGHVVAVGDGSARALLLQDLNSRIPVVVEPTNVRAFLIGDNSLQPRLEYLPPNVTVSAGDRIVTTSDGGLLPPGIPVGIVAGTPGDYRAALFADQDRLDFVRTLQYEFPRTLDADPSGEMVSSSPQPSEPPQPSAQ